MDDVLRIPVVEPRKTDDRVLTGQRALVTGAHAGIGAAVARALAEAGAAVVVHYTHHPQEAEQVVQQIKAQGGKAVTIEADLSREDQLQAMFRQMTDTYGSIDILVTTPSARKDAPLVHSNLADWEHVLKVNLTGLFLCAREAAREFIRRGVTPELSCSAGKIICLASVHNGSPGAGQTSYAASEGGVRMLVKALARELAVYKIRVNGISAGLIKTVPSHRAWTTPEREAELLELIPYGRLGQVTDIAQAVVWLASDASDYITGTTLYVDGGMALQPLFGNGG